MSGIDRKVELEELRACWPHIQGAAPKSYWKHLTNNSSYLEAIYDDLVSGEGEHGMAGLADTSGTDSVIRLKRRVEELEKALATADADRLEAEASRRDLEAELRELSGRVAAGEANKANEGSAVAELRVRLKLAEQSLRIAGQEREASDLARIGLEKQLRAVEKAALTAEGRANEARREALDLRRERDDLSAAVEDGDRGAAASWNGLLNDAESCIRPDLWASLEHAAQLAVSHPTASVAESRRTLEQAIGLLWSEARGGSPDGITVAEMLDGLRSDPLLPATDWHLAKNLYARASSIIHGGGASRPDLAVWMYLGCVQFCELVPS